MTGQISRKVDRVEELPRNIDSRKRCSSSGILARLDRSGLCPCHCEHGVFRAHLVYVQGDAFLFSSWERLYTSRMYVFASRRC